MSTAGKAYLKDMYLGDYGKFSFNRDPSYYRLLMAEENGEVDRDLPPIDGHRCLSELGSCWSTVALVHRSEITPSGSVNKVVV